MMRFDDFLQRVGPVEWIVEGLLWAAKKDLIVSRSGSGESWFLEADPQGGRT